MVLIGADEQRGGEVREAVLRGIARGGAHAQPVTHGAAPVKIAPDRLQEGPQAVSALHHQRKADLFRIVDQRVAAHAELRERVDVGIVPEAHGLDPLSAQRFNAHDGARGAADMQKQLHIPSSFICYCNTCGVRGQVSKSTGI